ncbi:bifunctional SET domain superfamily/SET domain [Babesia duncani]|uniref:Bifunctional SET domain superfamily/SET domain n=1 Tax=Babesia duncani TaxID=323732 RepID=A0AAD9PJS7_9APIC|nr:bifunctional SET domain superfamily/SET domain [Babesia duncani]
MCMLKLLIHDVICIIFSICATSISYNHYQNTIPIWKLNAGYLYPKVLRDKRKDEFHPIGISDSINKSLDPTYSYIKSGQTSLISAAESILSEEQCIINRVEITGKSRLEYNYEFLKETFKLAKDVDISLTGNEYDDQKLEFLRFPGDNELEFGLTSKCKIEKGDVIIKVPLEGCWSLSSIRRKLYNNFYHLKHLPELDKRTSLALEHTDSLLKLCQGKYFNIDSYTEFELKKNLYNGTKEYGICDAKLHRFFRLKQLQLLHILTLTDALFLVNNALSKALESTEYELASLNSNEREIYLLSLALCGEYFIKISSALFSYNSGYSNSFFESNFDRLKYIWLHHLFKKEVSHLPLLMTNDSVKQIQEPIVRYRILQRKLACNDLFNLINDPLYVIQDSIEHISQAHYKLEDSIPIQSGVVPITAETRKIECEENMEKIESLISTFHKKLQTKAIYNLFNISNEEYSDVFKADVMAPVGESTFDDVVESILFNNNLNKDNIILKQGIKALQNVFNLEFLTKAIAIVTSHIIRVGTQTQQDIATQYQRQSYLNTSGGGILCEKVDTNKKESYEAFIVPLLDVCNHGSSESNSRLEYSNEKNNSYFQLKAYTSIANNSELTINYGDYDNNQLLIDYGFASPHDNNNKVLMHIKAEDIIEAAQLCHISHLIPSHYPTGLPKEKIEVLKQLNLIKMPMDDIGILSLYQEPYYEGVPVEKFVEFNNKFLQRETAKPLDDVCIDKSESSSYIPPDPITIPTIKDDKTVIEHVLINYNGVPDYRLIYLLKVSFCPTSKRLDWIKQQDPEYISTSINSNLDVCFLLYIILYRLICSSWHRRFVAFI